LSYGVTQRTPELGLRMALGAPASNVRWLVVRDSAWTILGGVAAGLLTARAVVSGLRSQLFGVEPNHPAVMIAGTVLLVLLALVSRRAAPPASIRSPRSGTSDPSRGGVFVGTCGFRLQAEGHARHSLREYSQISSNSATE
jgi:hypothetical protein